MQQTDYPSEHLVHVTPIHKGNSRLAVTNYRPISVLPIISKVFEQTVHERDFFISHNIIYEHQFGFQKNKSTSLAVLDIYSELIKFIENKEFSCCISLLANSEHNAAISFIQNHPPTPDTTQKGQNPSLGTKQGVKTPTPRT